MLLTGGVTLDSGGMGRTTCIGTIRKTDRQRGDVPNPVRPE